MRLAAVLAHTLLTQLLPELLSGLGHDLMSNQHGSLNSALGVV